MDQKNPLDFHGSGLWAVILGGSSGFGLATAQKLAVEHNRNPIPRQGLNRFNHTQGVVLGVLQQLLLSHMRVARTQS